MRRWAGDGRSVELRVWHVTTPWPALRRMATDRRLLAHTPGLRFARLLGTGRGTTFSPRDADLHHWALLTSWADDDVRDAWDDSPLVRSWRSVASAELRVRMRPVGSRGRWSGVEPFAPTEDPVADDAPVAALTRARLRPLREPSFRRAVPAVAAALRTAPGVRLAIGIGEAPVGLQGTFSLWDSTGHLTDFAHRGAAHRDAIRHTGPARWYAEELFARFAVTDVAGTYAGRRP